MNASETRDFLLVYMVDHMNIGRSFQNWPLHMTIVPWFKANDERVIVDAIQPVVSRLKPFTANIGKRIFYGSKRKQVMSVNLSEELKELHVTLLSSLQTKGFDLRGRYIGNNYTPHVSQQMGRDVERDMYIDKIYIAEALPQGYRKLLASVKIGMQ